MWCYSSVKISNFWQGITSMDQDRTGEDWKEINKFIVMYDLMSIVHCDLQTTSLVHKEVEINVLEC